MIPKYNRGIVYFNVLLIAVALIYFINGLVYDSYNSYFLALSLISLSSINIPLFTKEKIDFFEPIFLVQFSVIIGVTLRSFFIVYSDSPRADFLIDWLPIHDIVENQPWIVIGLLSLSIGYISCPSNKESVRGVLHQEDYDFARFKYIIIAGVVLSLYGSYIFATSVQVDFSDLETISNKRPMELEGGEYTALGHIQLLAGISEQILYVYLLAAISKKQKFSNINIILLAILFISASITPFLNSSRSEIGLIFINILILLYYRKGIQLRNIISTVIVILVIVTVMANLRSLAQDSHVGNAKEEDVIEAVVGSGNFLDVGRTSIIIDRVPQEMNYKYGETYLYWMVGWIPKVVWPDKPNVSMGPSIKSEIYNLPVRNHGYPPGMIAEAYINFGYPGIILIMFIFGFLLRKFYLIFREWIPNSDLALLIYTGIIWRLAFGGIGLNFSQMIMQCLMNVIPLLIIYFAVRPKLKLRNDNVT